MTKNRKVIVFFGCSMRGKYGVVSKEDLAKLPDIIEYLGCELSSKHQTEEGIIAREDELTPSDIHDRDYDWLLSADIGVFEISNPSLGVGGEISDMIHAGKPVLCLFQGDQKAVSAYIRGKQGSKYVDTPFKYCSYFSLDDAKAIIAGFVKTNS